VRRFYAQRKSHGILPKEEAQFGGETGPADFQAELFGPRLEHPALRRTTYESS
jgi:hypothetical protein